MASSKLNGDRDRPPRRWAFANCVFDELNWTLTVDGRRVAVEAKPLEMLRELLLNAGNIVTKDELLDRVWPEVTVVEASLTTAVRKLRTALKDDRRRKPLIETVPRIGYRLAVPVSVEESSRASTVTLRAPAARQPETPAAGPSPAPAMRLIPVAAVGAIALLVLAMASGLQKVDAGVANPATVNQGQAADAIRELDVDAVKRMIAAGWKPAAPWDKEGNDALSVLLNRCEWDQGHDRRQMLLMARTLIEGGAPIDRRNVWGDTAYSIAKAPRYCGPDHPITQMLEAMCYGGTMGPKDRCLATYELTAEQRRAQGLPPKAGPFATRVGARQSLWG